MLTRLAGLGIRAPRWVLGIAGLLLVLAGVFGAPVAAHLGAGGFTDPSSPSSRADDLLARRFDAGTTNLVFTVETGAGADSAAARHAGTAIVAALRRAPNTSEVRSYWTVPAAQAKALRSANGAEALVLARVAGDDAQAPLRAAAIAGPLTGNHDGVRVRAGGVAIAYNEVNTHVKSDLAAAEAVAIPLTVIALIWVFGSVLAALLPLAIGLVSIIGTMAVLRGLALVTNVSVYALNMTTALGLALAIDYSLFVVSRYREEIRAGRVPQDAVRRTMQTAGRTVLFSALTVALSLAAMLVFPVYFLRSFAYAGIAVVVLATIAALVLLPAMLTMLGGRVDAWDLRALARRVLGRPAPVSKPVEQGFWYRVATWVMRRALPVGLVVTALLLALGLPFRHIHFGYPDDRALPPSAAAYQVGHDLRTLFDSNATSTITVVAPTGAPAGAAGASAASPIAAYAASLSRLSNVTSVSSAAGTFVRGTPVGGADPAMAKGGATYLDLRTDADPQSATAKRTVAAVREVRAPWAVEITGQTAGNQDALDALGSALPWAVLWIVLATFVVLFLFTGSLLLPLKALVLNTLSLSATFGAMVWIFQEGHLHGLFPDLTVTGSLSPTMPPLMFCLAFGLSMDYEVFLLSRIREAWLESGRPGVARTAADNAHAVALGLGRTGRIVTAAAVLMSIVFASMATSGVAFMMLFGTGLTLAVLMDATIVRGVLVPAFMRLAGRANWWAPRPLARLHARIGLAEAPATGPDEVESSVQREPVGV